MSGYQLRRLTRDDAAALEQLYKRCGEATIASRRFLDGDDAAKFLSRNEGLVAVDSSGGVQGVASWKDAGHGRAEVTLLVADSAQGRGLGTLLGRAMFDAVRAAGFERACGAFHADNEKVRRLLARYPHKLEKHADLATFCGDLNERHEP
jgi:L-amino acid N-acyltransferase YncA